jgi:hypothetical protein
MWGVDVFDAFVTFLCAVLVLDLVVVVGILLSLALATPPLLAHTLALALPLPATPPSLALAPAPHASHSLSVLPPRTFALTFSHSLFPSCALCGGAGSVGKNVGFGEDASLGSVDGRGVVSVGERVGGRVGSLGRGRWVD